MEMNSIEIERFLKRFCFFYDAVIREIHVCFLNSLNPTKVKITLSSKEETSSSNNDWINVTIEIEDVLDFAFLENNKESYQVLSNGLHILISEGLVFFDFGFFIDEPENAIEYKDSRFRIIGKKFNWSLSDYKE